MNNNNNEELMKFKEALLKTGLFNSRPRSGEYTMKECPYCGDMKNHMYVNIDLSSDKPVMFKCFKCNSGGIMKQDFLDRCGIEDIKLPKYRGLKKITANETAVTTKIPDINVSVNDDIYDVCKYIKRRIGTKPTLSELQMFGYIGDPYKYANEYLGNIESQSYIFNDKRYWFRMTNGNIIGRHDEDEHQYRWFKYKTDKVRTAGLYNIRVPVDLGSTINVIIAEGIIDVIGLFYNYKEFDNCIYVGVLGKDYTKGIRYILNKGIFGSSVNIKIFLDPNVSPYKVYIDDDMRQLFNKIDFYQNNVGKDYGVLPDELDIHKVVIYDNKKRRDD